MAEDKEKKSPEEEEGEGKKKGLPPVVLVALGAALGGAGMVFLSPAPAEQDHGHHVEPEPEYVLREHPDILVFHFNPRQDRGSVLAKLEFQFVYKIDKRDEEKIVELIKMHWNRMYSDLLLRVRRETPNQLRNEDAVRILANELMSLMSATLFPHGEAVVTQIIWKKIYIS